MMRAINTSVLPIGIAVGLQDAWNTNASVCLASQVLIVTLILMSVRATLVKILVLNV